MKASKKKTLAFEKMKILLKNLSGQKIALIPYQKNRENIKKFLEEKSIFH